MRIVIALGLLFGLFFAEACYQRHVYRVKYFRLSLEAMRATLGELTISDVTIHMARQRFAQAMRQVLEEGRRRAKSRPHS